MCGITGWVNLYGNIEQEDGILFKMTDTLKKRGPDDSGFYFSKHAILGHRRLVVVDPKGGAQPMTKKIGDNTYTIVYNGELYNTEDVRKTLKENGFTFSSYSDTEVLLVAYIFWGAECVKHINGIYAFGVWNEKEQKLFLARDPLGVKPLFYTIKDNSLIFGSEIKTLLAHPMVEPILDKQGLTELFGFGPARPLGSGIFKNISELPPAFSLSYSKNGLQTKEYWKLTAKTHDENLSTTSQHLRSLLVDSIERQLVADVPVCTFLSGGLDSSIISAVASSYFKRNNLSTLNTYFIDYIDNKKFFKPTEFQPNSDADWINKMVDYIGSDHHNILIDTPELTSALRSAVLANDLPGMADVDSSLFLFCNQVRKNATVALSGECADELFGGYPWFTREEDINATTFPWSKSVSDRKSILSHDLQSLPLEAYVQEKYDESLRQVPSLSGESQRENRMRELFYLNIKWFMITLLTRKDRMSMSNSLEVRVPFADYRLVEYAYNIPMDMKYYKGREKGLLRESLTGLLPDDVLWRKKSPYPKTHNPNYTIAVQKWMNSILQDKSSPILQIINKEKVQEIVDSGGLAYGKPWFGQLMAGPQLIAYLIQVDTWLREYKVIIE
ncbi:asparagine synthase (glutamine-hydrolyzing) [Clostridium bowmanii]|uniref:asparagine synthase (glutamine-hydrolyzing) n=1 Tax=Clostridium bowmanii TaxID=132925 RepID=UPI001C0ACF13|nr:asparagine synthase (glutamine-hydrolyzing) [Clostridium bowmanii]MBU3189339.1 asparagine synthase (glutamine-hydrolyzing) [Clostridium bowmanii]MCA1073955.1 asparagine synthase (glutamine-hydrolyzing) [Clostridium bowmanii]